MRITIDDKLYFKPINPSSKLIKSTKINGKLINILSKVWPWVVTFVMFFGLAVLGLRCF